MLYVVPPLIVKVLQTTDPQQLVCSMSSVRLIYTSAVSLSHSTISQINTALPHVKLLQRSSTNFIDLLQINKNIVKIKVSNVNINFRLLVYSAIPPENKNSYACLYHCCDANGELFEFLNFMTTLQEISAAY